MYIAPPCQSSPTYPLQRPPSLCHSPYCTHELHGIEAKPPYPSNGHICASTMFHLNRPSTAPRPPLDLPLLSSAGVALPSPSSSSSSSSSTSNYLPTTLSHTSIPLLPLLSLVTPTTLPHAPPHRSRRSRTEIDLQLPPVDHLRLQYLLPLLRTRHIHKVRVGETPRLAGTPVNGYTDVEDV